MRRGRTIVGCGLRVAGAARLDGAAGGGYDGGVTHAKRPALGAAILFTGATLWGFGFLAQKESVRELAPLWAMAIRFAIAAPVAVLVAVAVAWRSGRGAAFIASSGVRLRDAALLGAILFGAYWLQTAALTRTPVARVALITGLYAAFVPLLAPVFGHGRPKALHWGGAGLGLAGLALLVGVVGAAAVPLNDGDALVLGHAVFGAVHVLVVGRLVRDADPAALNALQLVALAAITLPVAWLVEGAPPAVVVDRALIASFAYLAVFSTVVGFLCQVAGQKHVSPSTAAVLMLLETPVGAIAALVALREPMTPVQAVGAVLLVVGVLVSLAGDRAAARATR